MGTFRLTFSSLPQEKGQLCRPYFPPESCSSSAQPVRRHQHLKKFIFTIVCILKTHFSGLMTSSLVHFGRQIDSIYKTTIVSSSVLNEKVAWWKCRTVQAICNSRVIFFFAAQAISHKQTSSLRVSCQDICTLFPCFCELSLVSVKPAT